MMEGWTNKDPYTTKVEEVTCRLCDKVFSINAQYDKNGFPVSFQPKYCNECNLKMKINNNVCVNSNDLTCGSVSVDIGNVPQNRVEGLQESLTNLSLNIKHGSEKLNALESGYVDFTSQQVNLNSKQADLNIDILKLIDDTNLQHNIFKSAQKNFNDDQIGINLAHFALIKEIHKTLIIGFSVLVVFMLATWGYLTYTFFNQ